MSQSRIIRRVLGACLIGFMGMSLWAFGRLVQSEQTLASSIADTQQCQRLTSQIRQIKQRPILATAAERTDTELVKQIEEAARGAGIQPEQLVSVTPELPHRLGDGPYLEKPTRMQLRSVSMQQAITFLHSLSRPETRLQVRTLRFIAPREAQQAETWNLETTLIYLIYSPRATTEG